MSDVKENAVISEDKEWKTDNGDWIWYVLVFALCFGGWGSSENPRMVGLEKKVARLEGQMSMIGGKFHE